MYKFFIVLIAAMALVWTVAACGAVPFGSSEPTATATRRVRATFTPKPPSTPTDQATPTDAATATNEPVATDAPTETDVLATRAPTSKPVAVKPKATVPVAPPPPAKPKYTINVTSQYLCDQQGIYKIILNAKRGKNFAGDLVYGIFDQGGHLLQDGAGKNLIGVTQAAINVSIGSNCRVEADFVSPNSSNGELDVTDAVRAGTNPVIVRFIKSATDYTGLSPDITVNFGAGGQYWMYIQAQ